MMTVEKVAFRDWSEAYICVHGAMRLTVVTEIGPRIFALQCGDGPNLLYEDTQNLRFSDWRLYGGHRFLLGPESAASYAADNVPCDVTIADRELRVASATPTGTVYKTLSIRPCEVTGGFKVSHQLRNDSPMPWDGAAWAITCVQPQGVAVVPWGAGSRGWRNNMVRYWSRVGDAAFAVDSEQWQVGPEVFRAVPRGQVGKVGLYTDAGWLAWLRKDSTFIKRFAPVREENAYSEGGCNVELYTCAHFVELETLGPTLTVYPGQELVHQETWILSSQVIAPNDWKRIETVTAD